MTISKMLCVALISINLASCGMAGTIIGALPTVIQLVQDAQLVLDQIDLSARPFFEREENAERLDQYNRSMYTAKKALQIALRASEGGQEMSDADLDAAFDDFRVAYKELLVLLRETGVMSAEGAMKASNGVNIDVDAPLAVTRKSK